MARPWRDPLRDRLRRRVCELTGRPDEVPSGEVEQLERLARLVELRDAFSPSRRARWWRGGLLLVFAIFSVLLFVRVGSTAVTMDLAVDELGFALAGKQKLTDILRLESVGAGGLREIHLPRGRGRAAEVLRPPEGGVLALRLSAAAAGEAAGSLTLASLALPAGSRCWLARGGEPGRVRLSLRGEDLALRIDAHGIVEAQVPGRAAVALELPSPRGVSLVAAGRELELDLTVGVDSVQLLSPQLEVEDLSFVRVDELVTAEHSLIRSLSTIRSGTLYLEALGDRERRLRRGEMLRFARSSGRLRSLRLEDDHLALDFRGRVRGMSLGVDPDRRSLMPTWLVLLHARRSLGLYLGVAIGLLSFLQLVRGWWRSR